jgi:hypothetical protein
MIIDLALAAGGFTLGCLFGSAVVFMLRPKPSDFARFLRV